MKSTVEIFSELGMRLSRFGSDEVSRSAMVRAVAENEWFAVGDIRYAIDAICREMLDAEKIENWLSRYPSTSHNESKRVALIVAGNIPLVGFFDLMCVLASGNTPFVKPSSKDKALMEYVQQLLLEIEPSLRIEKYVEGADYDAVIATGGESANLYFRSAFEGVPSLLRGSRHSVAVLTGRESKEALNGLADDIFTYSGLGCRNVSLVFVPKGYKLSLPTRKMSPAYHNNYLQCRALLTMHGVKFQDLGEVVIVKQLRAEFPRFLSQINVVEYSDLSAVKQWLAENDELLQCVVSEIDGLHSRCVPFGQAQSPTLFDYADDRDTMQFLALID